MTLSLPEASDVQQIVKTSLGADTLRAMIADAALIVEDCASIATYTPQRQQAIIKYVVAHMITTTGQGGNSARLSGRRLGDASQTYRTQALGPNLAGTTYGEQALALDPSGCLATIGLKRVVAVVVSR